MRISVARRSTARRPLRHAAVLVVAALGVIVLVGSAHAGPALKKKFDADVHRANPQTSCTSATCFKVTLTNDPASQVALGSANFTAPFPVPAAPAQHVGGWTIATNGSTLVTFRADSSSSDLAPGASVAAYVAAPIPSTCTNGAWTAAGKQSNDFSGTGNDFGLAADASHLTPLGSLMIADIGTIQNSVFFPQVLTGQGFGVTVTAKDSCGAPDPDYQAASIDVKPGLMPARLVGSTPTLPTTMSWSGGATTPRVGTLSITPVLVEAADIVRATDRETGIYADSNVFDVVDHLCTYFNTETCTFTNQGKSITAQSDAPPGNASLGLGYGPDATTGQCSAGAPIGLQFVGVSPHSYTTNYSVSIVYKKSISGSRPANSFLVCITKDDGLTWSPPLPTCGSPEVAPCIQAPKRTNGGDLLVIVVLSSDPGDPGIITG